MAQFTICARNKIVCKTTDRARLQGRTGTEKKNDMELTIRDAKPDDAAGIVAIFNPIIEARSFTLFDTPFSVEAEHSYIAGLTRRDIFHVAVRGTDQAIVGFQSMSPFATYTHAFDHVGVIGTYVDLGNRRQGIASSSFL